MPSFSFPTGIATEQGAHVVVQVYLDNDELMDNGFIAFYDFSADPTLLSLDWHPVSMCFSEEEQAVFALGADGQVVRCGANGESVEPLDELVRPRLHGPVRCIRSINGQLYVVGLGRQAYVRSATGEWAVCDDGLLDRSGGLGGLTAILAAPDGALVAVGYQGEIWEKQDIWTKIDSPVRSLLTSVWLHNGVPYAAGLKGNLIKRTDTGWQVVDLGITGDIWGATSFAGKTYLATDKGVYAASLDEQDTVCELSLPSRSISFSQHNGRLWSFGGDEVHSLHHGTWSLESIM